LINEIAVLSTDMAEKPKPAARGRRGDKTEEQKEESEEEMEVEEEEESKKSDDLSIMMEGGYNPIF
jgi:ribosomal protein L12E/L44/L45/RPP1/RPP2